jgi:transcriptional regulator with XRE-family HTH domain
MNNIAHCFAVEYSTVLLKNKKDFIKMNPQTLINTIQNLCVQKGVSVAIALKSANVNKDVISNIRKGTIPSIEIIEKLANYFDVSIDDLLGLTDIVPAAPSLTAEQMRLLQNFDKLSDIGKQTVINQLELELAAQENRPEKTYG